MSADFLTRSAAKNRGRRRAHPLLLTWGTRQPKMHIPATTLTYLIMIFGLLVVPRALQRFRLPAPLTCFVLGIVVAIYSKRMISDRVGAVVATFGIASLFLLAG